MIDYARLILLQGSFIPARGFGDCFMIQLQSARGN